MLDELVHTLQRQISAQKQVLYNTLVYPSLKQTGKIQTVNKL